MKTPFTHGGPPALNLVDSPVGQEHWRAEENASVLGPDNTLDNRAILYQSGRISRCLDDPATGIRGEVLQDLVDPFNLD